MQFKAIVNPNFSEKICVEMCISLLFSYHTIILLYSNIHRIDKGNVLAVTAMLRLLY